jgi:PncC family amidohydrolase
LYSLKAALGARWQLQWPNCRVFPNTLCGSLVTYRPKSKQRWLRVHERTIEKHSCESKQVAEEMAIGALRATPEASWAVSVVGHFGPDAPAKKDGVIYYCIARLTNKDQIKVKKCEQFKLSSKERIARQKEASEVVLTAFARYLLSWQDRDKKNGQKRAKTKAT